MTVDYRDFVARLATNVRIGGLETNVRRVDLEKEIFQVKDVRMDSTDMRFDDNKQKPAKAGDGLCASWGDGAGVGDGTIWRIRPIRSAGRSGRRHSGSGPVSGSIRLQTAFFYSDHRAQLNDLLLVTPGTVLRRAVTLRYDSLGGMIKDAAKTQVDLDLAGSRVKVRDILVFAPWLKSQPAFSRPDEVLAD